MSKSYEYQGKSVDSALEKASDDLNIPAEKIKHEVISYGSSGIFGLVGVKKAIIKVFVDDDITKPTRPKTVPKKPVDIQTKNGPIKESIDWSPESPESFEYDNALLESGTKALQKIVDQISDGATVNPIQKSDKLVFSISGGDSGILIGKRGQTLEAMQYLLEKMINKQMTERIRVLVDVEGYLDKRQSHLQQMAYRMAEKVRRTKKPVTIGQMNAHDRRIVHLQLKDEEGVRTQSIGEGYYRKLMIFPKNQGGPKRKNSNAKA
jgi:spoIIIJ-associated protein